MLAVMIPHYITFVCTSILFPNNSRPIIDCQRQPIPASSFLYNVYCSGLIRLYGTLHGDCERCDSAILTNASIRVHCARQCWLTTLHDPLIRRYVFVIVRVVCYVHDMFVIRITTANKLMFHSHDHADGFSHQHSNWTPIRTALPHQFIHEFNYPVSCSHRQSETELSSHAAGCRHHICPPCHQQLHSFAHRMNGVFARQGLLSARWSAHSLT